MNRFANRSDAGRQLAQRLVNTQAEVVVGLARGGVIVAIEVAKRLSLPLSILTVRKIGAPANPELALGAVIGSGEAFYNDALIGLLGVDRDYLKQETARQRKIAQERETLYPKQTVIKGKKILLVDDGIATGASVRIAIGAIKASHLTLAIPVASPDTLKEIAPLVDSTVCLLAPPFFETLGSYYRSFDSVTDQEILHLLE